MKLGEVPVGAVVVRARVSIVAEAHNLRGDDERPDSAC